jgi:pimeloyl-ACP methyl ester carboxylesterase
VANFVLVHGGWRGGWIWKRVAQQLRRAGHDVHTPTLSGLAERGHLIHLGINLSTHIQEVTNLIHFEDLGNVILCGHSYAGMVISGVADRAAQSISALVYLDAWFPKDGDSIMTLSPEAYRLGAIEAARGHHGFAVTPIPPAVLGVNEADRALVETKATPHPLATMTEAIQLEGNHLRVETKMYVLATEWGPSPFARFYTQLADDPSWTARLVPSGHDVMLDRPDAVIALLLEAAGAPQQATSR